MNSPRDSKAAAPHEEQRPFFLSISEREAPEDSETPEWLGLDAEREIVDRERLPKDRLQGRQQSLAYPRTERDAGKSTILRCIYGNYRPDAGRILVRNGATLVDVAAAAPREILTLRRMALGYVSQFLRVVPRVSAVGLVMEPALERGASASKARERAAALLFRLNIPAKLWDLPTATFSGGEQQRINIARGLVGDSPILLLDEPTASLDAGNRAAVIELLREARGRGATVVGVFHDWEVRDAVATRTLDLAMEKAA